MTPMVLTLQEVPDAPARPIRLGLSTGRNALIERLETMALFGVSHVSFNLRPNDRPVEELLRELAGVRPAALPRIRRIEPLQ
ncbi:hypothetical protein [Kitasatospora sp. HPMI-4]|uniref:hypothetical protein n=1 Tax=Kitasatospora sp. HPMI-4 TaxID=3448443 RepID=UPI003F1AD53E